ncbi:Glycerophosphoryl diester phosphodiesterase [compost metagenome]
MKLMGHRGARDRAPENTMRSFEALLESKVSVVEFDIHECADGVWVVHHDDTLNRTTTATGLLSEKSWLELSDVCTREGDKLPRLDDVLALYKNTAMELQIEIKSPGDFSKLGEILNKNFNIEQITVISFNHNWLYDLKTKHPHIKTTCLLFGLPLNPVEIVRSAKADGISLSVGWVDEALIKKCHEQNLTVTAWNANDIAVFRKMKSIGVDILGTDVPFTAIEWQTV